MKVCNKCGCEYEPTGRNQKFCPPCGVINARAYRPAKRNLDKLNKSSKSWYAKNMERERAKRLAYYYKNKETILEKMRIKRESM